MQKNNQENFFRGANRLKTVYRKDQGKTVHTFANSINNNDPISVLGNHKTGSTAVAALLAQSIRRSVMFELQKAIPDVGWQLCVKYRVTEFKEIASRYREDLCRPEVTSKAWPTDGMLRQGPISPHRRNSF